MRAGRLRHIITIQRPSDSRDSCGGPVAGSWSDFATVRASMESTLGKERYAGPQKVAEADTVFGIRALAGITPDMRILFNGRIFNIAASPMDPTGRGREQHILATEIAGQED